MSLLARAVLIHMLVVVGAFGVLLGSPFALVPPFRVGEIVVVVASFLALLGLGSWAVVRSLAPLRTLQHEIGLLGRLGESRRLTETGAPEVEAVARAFNGLLDRLADQERARIRVTLSAQEAERARVARELHDEIGQTLTFSVVSLGNVVADHPEWGPELDAPRESLREALEEMRGIAAALRPGVLHDLGLRAALEDLIQRAERDSGRRIHRDLTIPPGLSAEQELVVFRICQEALTNVLRHAGATAIEVGLVPRPDGLVLTVGDDGIGYAGSRGAGIEGMLERARLVDATVAVGNRPGGGTLVRLVLPPGSGGDDE